MNNTLNSLQNNTLSISGQNVPHAIASAIQKASDQSGVDFSYLVNQAKAESNFNPSIKASTSSATGLYQFIDSTWLQMVERYGDDYGIDTTGKSKSDILEMRKDPETASFMAAAFASENERFLNNHWGGDVGSTELYFAHFLGAGGAASFLNAKDENPLQSAADIFPKAARANHNVFYDKETGAARSVAQVYDFFDQKFQAEPKGQSAPAIAEDTEHYASLYSANPKSLSSSLVMLRAQEMRDNASNVTNILRIESSTKNQGNFGGLNLFGLSNNGALSSSLFTQITSPGHIIRDNG